MGHIDKQVRKLPKNIKKKVKGAKYRLLIKDIRYSLAELMGLNSLPDKHKYDIEIIDFNIEDSRENNIKTLKAEKIREKERERALNKYNSVFKLVELLNQRI